MSLVSNCITSRSLESYCKNNWSELHREKGNPGRKPKDAAEIGFTIYSRALCKGLGIAVIGPNRLRDDQALVDNVGKVLALTKKINQENSYRHSGAILGEKQWSAFVNDLYMLGSVHAKKQFHFSIAAEKELKLEDIWDAANNALTTTGRELLLLLMSGYKKACLKETLEKVFGHVFVPPCGEENPPISLERYREAIRAIKVPQTILDFFYSRSN